MPTVIEMPSLTSTMNKGKVVKWHKREGDSVKKGETLFEVETDKADVEVDSISSGFLRKILLQEGTEVPVNTPIAIISDSMDDDVESFVGAAAVMESSATARQHKVASPEVSKPARPKAGEEERIRISPLARRIAEAEGLDITTIRGTGPEGRITKEDVERAIAGKTQPVPLPGRTEAIREPDREAEAYQDIGLTQMRRAIAQRLRQSKVTAPHFYVDVSADATALEQLKRDLQRRTGEQGTKISFDGILVKIAAQALREFPMVNACFLEDRIRLHKAINIGVAVALDEGLIVPVITNADKKSILQISAEVEELAGKARKKRLLPQECEGGTFTITNMGMFGVEGFHAIINPPESAILAVGAMIAQPAVVEGQICVRKCVKLSLSVDHRVVDGALAARFLTRIKEFVEAPLLMLA
jgi:pyruvate dehydrogenase E2 component (dihydrolipoamide acetyltransferase)